LEQATLLNKVEIVRYLTQQGAEIPSYLVHLVIELMDMSVYRGMLNALLESGADPNSLFGGRSPLMRTSLQGDLQTARMLLAFGADPKAISTDGQRAADFARKAGGLDLEEQLVLAYGESQYRSLMMGLSWSDTLSSLQDRLETCQDLGEDLVVCKLNVTPWLEDARIVFGQFDKKSSERLIALQIYSEAISDPERAVAHFERAREAIQSRIPEDHAGFLTMDIPSTDKMFLDLQPEVNRGRYLSYWSDQDREKPVFVHLNLSGLDKNQGFYQIVIGNPFRAG
jgi:hypothetical protein